MADKDYAPLSTACVKALNDKMYEKRKAAALEIEKMVREFSNDTVQIRKLLRVLGQDFATSQNPHSRKGSLIGLSAMAVGLGKDSCHYTEELIMPILECLRDPDLRVRYYACESLYNVVKVARGAVLVHFTQIFSALSELSADHDQNVKNGSELLDRLMKDIVVESSCFNLVAFIPLLRERLDTSDQFTRSFIISWLSVLEAVPNIDMVIFLPEILDGLFQFLEDPTMEIKRMCDNILSEFLCSIKRDPSRVDFAGMINILIAHSQASDEQLQFTAISWIKEFVQLSERTMLPFASGILTAVLPCLAYGGDNKKDIKETAKTVNFSLMKLITSEDDIDITNLDNMEINLDATLKTKGTAHQELDLPSVIDVLTKHLMQTIGTSMQSSVQTKVAVLRWIYHLHIKLPNKMFQHVDALFPVLLLTLSDASDEVVHQDLKVLAEIISSPVGKKLHYGEELPAESQKKILDSGQGSTNPYFSKFIISLLKLFSLNRDLLDDRGAFIIRQLCVLLNSEDIFRTLAEILLHEKNLEFASTMVETLNTILLTSSELFELRTKLKDLKTEESCVLFLCLYNSWCHNPVATVALCLLTQNYSHVVDLIRIFGNLEVTVEFLTEIDKLIQLIESPIFTYLRLELLEVPHNQDLVQALYGLLMLLPQSEAFHILRRRLDCISSLYLQQRQPKNDVKSKTSSAKQCKLISFPAMLKHFIEVQEKHRQSKQDSRTVNLLEKGVKNLEI